MNLRFLLFAAVLTLPAQAVQDDVVPVLRRPDALFSGNQENASRFLSARILKAGLGNYMFSDDRHAWEFNSSADLALLSMGADALWRFGLTIETLADAVPDNGFRLQQVYYTVLSGFEYKLGPGVMGLGYKHQCRHGIDHFTDQTLPAPDPKAPTFDSRVVILSGPQMWYHYLYEHRHFNLIINSALQAYAWGQNIVLAHQPRVKLSSIVQMELTALQWATPFVSAGLGVSWVARGPAKNYYIWSPAAESHARFSPTAALGVTIKGAVGDFKLYLAYYSNLDTGFNAQATPLQAASLIGEFWF